MLLELRFFGLCPSSFAYLTKKYKKSKLSLKIKIGLNTKMALNSEVENKRVQKSEGDRESGEGDR